MQGNLSVLLGNGNNTPFTLGGSVAGDLSFHVGNGNNNVTVAGPVAGNFNWNSGNGNDTLTLALSPAVPLYQAHARFGNGDDVFATTNNYNLNALLGNGNDSFTLDTNTGMANGIADDGGGTNTFTHPSGTLAPTFQLINF